MSTPQTIVPLSEGAIPMLEQGDRLTRAEFERRYEAMPRIKKAELLEGEVCMPSPVRLRKHANPHANLVMWMSVYEAHTPRILVGDNASVRLDVDSEPQPDVVMLVDPQCGGSAKVSADDCIEGTPELVAEVASSSKSIDLNKKFRIYRDNEVREYLVWRVQDGEIDWFAWRDDEYLPLSLDSSGWLRSVAFPGLWLDPAALVKKDLAKVLQVLQQGLASTEHVAFCAKLRGDGPAQTGMSVPP